MLRPTPPLLGQLEEGYIFSLQRRWQSKGHSSGNLQRKNLIGGGEFGQVGSGSPLNRESSLQRGLPSQRDFVGDEIEADVAELNKVDEDAWNARPRLDPDIAKAHLVLCAVCPWTMAAS